MKRRNVQNVDVTTEENTIHDQGKHDVSTKEEDYEFLDNIDFLQHIDMSDYEREIFSVENDTKRKEEEIKVNVDYLDDLAFFDELDYFEQLNKSLEEELKDLDTRIAAATRSTRRRWIKAHSDGILLGLGIGVMIVLGGGLIGVVGTHLSGMGKTYATTADGKAIVAETAAPQAAMSLVKEEAKPAQTPHKSESLIQKREEPKAVNTQASNTKTVSNEASDADMKQFYSDSVFIGNSLTEGLQVAGGVSTAKYLAVKSLSVTDALKKAFIGAGANKKTIPEALAQIKCKKIFVMFGVNELGWPYPKVFGERYMAVLKKIKEIQPDATIYVQSILPCAKWLGNKDKECRKSNIDAFNRVIKEAAEKTGCEYLDVGPAVANNDGYLPEDAAVDGMHLKKAYNKRWIAYIYNKLK